MVGCLAGLLVEAYCQIKRNKRGKEGDKKTNL
jgi:hypothetical protein